MMKIPETSANVGAYYGNENVENGQWQPNGVIIDGGVGGGVVGSGDAGMHRAPVYPLHIPRGHVPAGYVMAGAYYGAGYPPVPPQPDDFADYMWMENEEEFDKQVLQQLEEEALMEQCIEAMLEDEQRERRQNRENRQDYPTTSNGNPAVSLQEAVSRSTLNPLAAEFVPTRGRQAHTHTEEKKEPTASAQVEAPSVREEGGGRETEIVEERDSRTDAAEEVKTEEAASPPRDPPEVSAADILPSKPLHKKEKEVKKQQEPKKPLKSEPKKKPPVVVKSETKIQPKKKEVKTAKSDTRLDHDYDKTSQDAVNTTEAVKSEETLPELPKPPTVSPPTTEEIQTAPGLKPINYAAAARASKPKPKPTPTPTTVTTTPPVEKPTPKPEPVKEKLKTEKAEKKMAPKEKSASKEKVNVQRKNSTK